MHIEVSEALRIRLKSNYLGANVAELDKAIAMAEDLFLSETLLAPIEKDIRYAYLDFSKAFSDGRIHFIEREIVGLRNLCQATKEQVNSLVIADQYRKSSLSRIDQICSSAESDVAFISSSDINRNRLVSESVQERSNRSIKTCQDATSPIRCEMVEWLSAISIDKIMSMNSDQLKVLEEAWDQAEKGR